jgi:hypothetical protein
MKEFRKDVKTIGDLRGGYVCSGLTKDLENMYEIEWSS